MKLASMDLAGAWTTVRALVTTHFLASVSAGYFFSPTQHHLRAPNDGRLPDEAVYYESIKPEGRPRGQRRQYIHTLWLQPAKTVAPPTWRPEHHRGMVSLPYMPLPLVEEHQLAAPWKRRGTANGGFRRYDNTADIGALRGHDHHWDLKDATTQGHPPGPWRGQNNLQPNTDSFAWTPLFNRLHWTPVLTHLGSVSGSPGKYQVWWPTIKYDKNYRIKSTARPVTKPIAKPVKKQFVKPAAKPPAKPAERPVKKPFSRPPVKPVAKPPTKPLKKPVKKHFSRPAAPKPAVKPVKKQFPKPAAKPPTKPVKRPVKKPFSKPPVKPAAKPPTKPVKNPVKKHFSRPPAPMPAAKPVAKPVSESVAKLAATSTEGYEESAIENPVKTLQKGFLDGATLKQPATKPELKPTRGSVPLPPEKPPIEISTKFEAKKQTLPGVVHSAKTPEPKDAQVLRVSPGSVIKPFTFAGPPESVPAGDKRKTKSERGPGPPAVPPAEPASTDAAVGTEYRQAHVPPLKGPSPIVVTATRRPEKELSDAQVLKEYNFNPPGLILEMAVFYDADCHKSFVDAFGTADSFQEALSAIIGQVQVFYKAPWLKEPMHIVITEMTLLEKAPNELMTSSHADKLLKGFSNFTAARNAPDGQPGHWDVALLLTGKDMHSQNGGKNDTSVLGKAYIGGVCSRNFATVVVEFGSANPSRRPMTTYGFQTSNVVAHELAHNLGVLHDGPPTNGNCSLDRYLMGPWRTANTTTWWSECSLHVLDKLGDSSRMACLRTPSVRRLREALRWNSWRSWPPPGQQWDADAQCRVFLKSEAARNSAKPDDMSAVCESLQCKSPARIGLFGAGHALEGTYCGGNNWCKGSECVPFPKSVSVVPGGWSDWDPVSECSQPCLEHSVALLRMRRTCSYPQRKNTLEGCEGDTFALRPCDISANTKAPKCVRPQTNQEFIDEKCALFSSIKPELKPKGAQVPYSAAQSWRACSIHCGYRGDAFIPAKFLLNERTNETGVLPDGTRCHFDKDTGAAYYCQQGQCVTLLRSLAGGIEDNQAGQVLELEDKDWAPDTAGRRLVEQYLEYVPGKKFSVLDVHKVPKAAGRIAVDDL